MYKFVFNFQVIQLFQVRSLLEYLNNFSNPNILNSEVWHLRLTNNMKNSFITLDLQIASLKKLLRYTFNWNLRLTC